MEGSAENKKIIRNEQTVWNFLAFVIACVFVLSFVAYIYSFSFTGTWHFDDFANLGGLTKVHDLVSGAHYVFSGVAGPTGRPLSLFTFALQSSAWPDDPAAILGVNIALHLVNGALVFWATYLLGRSTGYQARPAHFLALMVGAVWMLSPFLASTHLMAVQRMTSLSGFFVFSGLILYLLGRSQMKSQPRTGILLIWTAILPVTALAAVSKENGALLPTLLLAVELILRCPDGRWRSGQARKLAMISMTIISASSLIFIAYRGVFSTMWEFRDFDLIERLMTQSRVLWDYIFHLLLPRATSGNPFNDNYVISTSLFDPVSTLFGLIGALTLITLIPVLYKRIPLAAFGIAWFLIGHLAESTVVPLEIYFAHRNYVPAMGLYIAVFAAIFHALNTTFRQKLVTIGSGAYLLILAFILFITTTTWGNPGRAAVVWSAEHPSSVRASMFLAEQQLANGFIPEAAETLDAALHQRPDDIYLLSQRLLLCDVNQTNTSSAASALTNRLNEITHLSFSEAQALHTLAMRLSRQACSQLSLSYAENFLRRLLQSNLRYQNIQTQNLVIYAAAQVASAKGDHSSSIEYLEMSMNIKPDPDTVIRIAYGYVLLDDIDSAVERLDKAIENPPNDFLSGIFWEEPLDDYRNALTSE